MVLRQPPGQAFSLGNPIRRSKTYLWQVAGLNGEQAKPNEFINYILSYFILFCQHKWRGARCSSSSLILIIFSTYFMYYLWVVINFWINKLKLICSWNDFKTIRMQKSILFKYNILIVSFMRVRTHIWTKNGQKLQLLKIPHLVKGGLLAITWLSENPAKKNPVFSFWITINWICYNSTNRNWADFYIFLIIHILNLKMIS